MVNDAVVVWDGIFAVCDCLMVDEEEDARSFVAGRVMSVGGEDEGSSFWVEHVASVLF